MTIQHVLDMKVRWEGDHRQRAVRLTLNPDDMRDVTRSCMAMFDPPSKISATFEPGAVGATSSGTVAEMEWFQDAAVPPSHLEFHAVRSPRDGAADK